MDTIQNIQSIVAVTILVAVNIVAIIKGVNTIVKRIQEIWHASPEEKYAVKGSIIENLRQVIFGWVTDAEKDLGGGTGKLKSAKVAAMIYEYIPDDFKPLFSSNEIQSMIDTALDEAKQYWEKNGKAREYIESGAPVQISPGFSSASVANDLSAEEIAEAISASVSAVFKTAAETDQSASSDGSITETRQEPASSPQDSETTPAV